MDLLLTHLTDIAVILIVICITAHGHRRGILRMIISIVSFVVSAAAAAFISNVTYEYVYFHAVQPAVISVIQTETDSVMDEYNPADRINEIIKNQDILFQEEQLTVSEGHETNGNAVSLLTNEEIRGKLNSVFTEYCTRLTDSLKGVLPDEIVDSAEKYLEKNAVSDQDKLDFFNNSSVSLAELIEKEIARPVLLKTVKSIIFALAFFAVNIIFSIIARIVGILRGITEIREADSFFGGLLGLVYSLLTLAAMSLICSIFIKFTGDANTIINTEIISNTWIFKYIYAGTFEIIAQLLN
ncbi:MAG: CvpA family protein [Oscillospiraceae bacterium]|nr:CvpA family protein [Oscillospiraceae bacterium]